MIENHEIVTPVEFYFLILHPRMCKQNYFPGEVFCYLILFTQYIQCDQQLQENMNCTKILVLCPDFLKDVKW